MDFKKFMDMKVDLNTFTDVYNSYAKSKKDFGGGQMKVKDLLKKNGGKFKPSKSKKGGAVTDDDSRDNFFYTTKPSSDFTNVNIIPDINYKSNDLPQTTNAQRGIF